MILVNLPPGTILFRALTPQWASRPTSGAGAALQGGRFNREGVEALARGCTGILFPSLAHEGGTNLVVYFDRLQDGNSITVNDPDGRLPRDQSSWAR